MVIDDSADMPFEDGSFNTISFLACLNHIPNRDSALKEAHRVLSDNGKVIITMITPKWGRFIHWWRRNNDPDENIRHINRGKELLGMSAVHIYKLLSDADFVDIKRKRFVFGLNSIYSIRKIRHIHNCIFLSVLRQILYTLYIALPQLGLTLS